MEAFGRHMHLTGKLCFETTIDFPLSAVLEGETR
jgi:hypothetical protein